MAERASPSCLRERMACFLERDLGEVRLERENFYGV